MLLLAVVKYRNKIGYMHIPGSKKRTGGRFLHRSNAGHRVKRPPDAARRSGAAPLGPERRPSAGGEPELGKQRRHGSPAMEKAAFR